MKGAARGFSLIELLITVAIAGILLATGASSYRIWISNMRVRTAAESIQNGLQLARGEAVRRNAQIQFQLMSSVDNTCVLSPPNAAIPSTWVISFANPAGACASAAVNDGFPIFDLINNPLPQILQVRQAEGSQNVVVNAGQTLITFNGLGRLAAVPATNPVAIEVTNPVAGTCQAVGGDVRCLRVTVTVGGQIRMCDPRLTITNAADPQSCQ
jgi:type IV fimbrial biogenesis protein FimT